MFESKPKKVAILAVSLIAISSIGFIVFNHQDKNIHSTDVQKLQTG